MCGFVGFTGLREQREAILHRMADRIIHRGPDMEGYHISGDDPRTAIALGFRRLSIIDLAAGKQPMYNEDGTVVCVFNGEIYNFMDLRTELQAKGHIFKTHCDTEVIIHGYEEYGTALAARLRGMFAFVVWDTKTNEMYGARDIFGIKPFYYTQTDAGELSQKLGIKNYREMLTKEQCLDAFADIQYHMDEPQSNPSSVPLYFLCQLARQHVTVVLSGEGADEIYAGYEWYADTPLMQKYKHIPAPLRHLASDASQHLPYFKGHDFIIKGSGRPEDWFIGQAHVFEEKDAYDILRPKYRVGPTAREVAAPIYDRVKDLSELEKKQYLDLNLWLPGDILLKADKMSMAHSLELRVPYLDREVLREAQTYPDSYKLRGDTKAVLRTAANKTLPDAWANRTKKGFPVPIAKWLEDPAFSAKVRKSFTSDVAAEYFDQDKLVAMLADPKHERRKIWTAYTFLTWHEQFFEKFDA